MKTFRLDEKNKKKLDENINQQLHLKDFNFGMLNTMVEQSLDIATVPAQPDETVYPTDGGRAGTVFKELAKLNNLRNLPGYAYFSYEQSFLKVTPKKETNEAIELEG